MARFDLEKLAEELAAKVRPDFEREIERARAEGYRAGIEAAAKWVEGQNTAPHFTAQLRFTIADGIRRALAAPSPEAAAPATPTRSVSEYLSTICGDFGHPIFKLPCCLSPGHPGPHDNGSGDPWPNRALSSPPPHDGEGA